MDDDNLQLAELVPVSGSWHGLLFDNPRIDLAPELTWTFTIDFAEVERPDGTVTPNLCVDWVPLPRCSWRAMSGLSASASIFAEPIESSVYYFEHHRYDQASLQIAEQIGDRVRVTARVAIDVDGLGIESINVDQWSTFTGVIVQLSDPPPTVETARSRLEAFTDTEGLVGTRSSSGNYVFTPGG